jgi:hypothetical protein
MDLDNLVGKIEATEAKAIERIFLNEGSSVIRIDGMLTYESQKGQNFCILEATVVSSDVYAPETAVKQMWALSGVDKWRIDANLALIKAVIMAANPGKPLDGLAIKAAITGGRNCSIAGLHIKATAIEKMSDRGKSYKDWSYQYAKVDTPRVTPNETVTEVATAKPVSEKSEDIPDFDM